MARLDVLFAGYGGDGVASTVSLIRDGEAVIIVDPGMVPSRARVLEALVGLGVAPEQVTDIVLSHHHPDHTMNIALFPEDARVHDHWAVYRRDQWTPRGAEGSRLSPGVTLWETPGHTPQDITTIVETAEGVAALTHLWVYEGSAGASLDVDPASVRKGRQRVLEVASLIVPGHGPMFRVR